jgi:hypothetical protein
MSFVHDAPLTSGMILGAPIVTAACIGSVALFFSAVAVVLLLLVGICAALWATDGLIPSSEVDARRVAWIKRDLPPAVEHVDHALADEITRDFKYPLYARNAVTAFMRREIDEVALDRRLFIAAGFPTVLTEDEWHQQAAAECRRALPPSRPYDVWAFQQKQQKQELYNQKLLDLKLELYRRNVLTANDLRAFAVVGERAPEILTPPDAYQEACKKAELITAGWPALTPDLHATNYHIDWSDQP